MLIFLIYLIIIILTIYTFFISSYFKKLDFLDKILHISIFLFIIWFLITIYYIYCFFYQFITINPFEIHQFFTNHPFERFLHFYFTPFIYFILSFIILTKLYILLHIFVFWIIIIIFVPFIMIFPIPIIPFILPIPLKSILLELPPFKQLTDRGILPLLRRIIFGFFFTEDKLKHFISSFFDINSFFYENIKNTLNDFIIINEPKNYNKISKGIQDDKYKTQTIDDNTDNEEISNQIINDDKNNINKNKIIDEYLVCVKSKKSLNNYKDTNIYSNKINDNQNELDCNFDNLKNYIKIKI